MKQSIKDKLSLFNPAFILSLIVLIIISTANTMIGGYRAVYVTQELGATATAAGVVGMWWTYGSMVVRLFVGRFSSKWGDQKLLVIGSIGYGLTLAAAALTTDVTNFTIVIVLQAICHPFCYITSNSLLSKAIPKGQEGTGTYLFVGIPSAICSAAGPWIANACIKAAGFDLLFICAGLMMSFCVLLSIGLIIYSRKRFGAINSTDSESPPQLGQPVSEPRKAKQHRGIRGFIEGFIEVRALGPCFLQILGNLAEMAVMMYGMMYATELGIPECGAIMFTAVSISQLVVTFLLGSVMDRFGMISVLLPGAAMGIAAYMVFLFGGTSYAIWVIAGVLYGVAAGCMRPTFNAGMIKMVSKDRLNVATSNFALATSIGGGIAGVVIGAFIDNTGYNGVWIFSSIMYAVVFLMSFVIFRKYMFSKKSTADS